MNRLGKKIILITLYSMLFLTCLLGLSSCSGKIEKNNFNISEKFKNITIETSDADIVISPSKDGLCKVVAQDKKNYRFSVSVVNDTLRITEEDNRKWYQKIFNFKSRKLTVYIPEDYYNSLAVNNATGDLKIDAECNFNSISVEFSTGDITCLSSVTEDIYISGSTGDITLMNLSANQVNLNCSTGDIMVKDLNSKTLSIKCTTGDISASNVICEEDFDVQFTTGDVDLSNVACRSQHINGKTGDVNMRNLVAREELDLRVTTGDVFFADCDASEVYMRCTTGDIEGSFLTTKIIFAETKTGDVDVPKCYDGGKCDIQTTTGDIELRIKGK